MLRMDYDSARRFARKGLQRASAAEVVAGNSQLKDGGTSRILMQYWRLPGWAPATFLCAVCMCGCARTQPSAPLALTPKEIVQTAATSNADEDECTCPRCGSCRVVPMVGEWAQGEIAGYAFKSQFDYSNDNLECRRCRHTWFGRLPIWTLLGNRRREN